MATNISSLFRDINPFYMQDGKADTISGIDSIKANLKCLFVSYIGCRSRSFNPSWGGQLLEALGEPISEVTALQVTAGMLSCIRSQEPRIRVSTGDVIVTPDVTIPGYRVQLSYGTVNTEFRDTFNFNLAVIT